MIPTQFQYYCGRELAQTCLNIIMVCNTYTCDRLFFTLYIVIANSVVLAHAVITHLKSIFARHAIPQYIMTDNGLQFSAHVFSTFLNDYGFTHITSSPWFPQSNGEAEHAVKTVKALLKKYDYRKEDHNLALMAYRVTSLECGYSPAQLLKSCVLWTYIMCQHLTNSYSLKYQIFQLSKRRSKR